MQPAARPSGWTGRAGARIAPLFEMDQRRLAALLSLLLLAAGWSAIWSARASYAVEGVVSRVIARRYPWDAIDKFDLVVTADSGRAIQFVGLHGGCAGSPRHLERCIKPEFPVGARIRVEANAFIDPNACGGSGIGPREFRCTGRPKRRFGRADFYVTGIEVAGAPVTTGWSANLGVLAWYGFALAAAFTLWRHEWRLSAIPARTIIACCIALSAILFSPLAWMF